MPWRDYIYSSSGLRPAYRPSAGPVDTPPEPVPREPVSGRPFWFSALFFAVPFDVNVAVAGITDRGRKEGI